jgi:hypothetical protein
MTAPIIEGIHKVEGRSSVEINDSCNNCCPCFPRRVKHHKKHSKPSEGPNIQDMIAATLKTDSVSSPLRVDVATGQLQQGSVRGSSIVWKPMPSNPEGSK